MGKASMNIPGMGIVQNLPVPDLTPFRRVPPTTPCAPPIDTCDDLVTTDLRATAVLHEFLTRVAQGFAAYKDIATSAVQTYAAGQEESEAGIRASCASAAPGLPNINPALTSPAPDEE